MCAIDLAGDEAAYPTGDFADIFRQAASEGIPFTIHAGEAAGAESVWKALELGAVRIGHGIRSASDKALMDTLSEKAYILKCVIQAICRHTQLISLRITLSGSLLTEA